jgi:hypothetical protein
VSAARTSRARCRSKRAYETEERALQALSDVQAIRMDDATRERRAYPCSFDGTHWHLTGQPVRGGGDAETLRYIATLERTVVFLLREIERSRHAAD